MPVCRMEMGKSGWGLLLSHRRNSGWGSSTWSCSTNLSSCGIQLSDKWQLARNTQLPWNNQTNVRGHKNSFPYWNKSHMAEITQILWPKKSFGNMTHKMILPLSRPVWSSWLLWEPVLAPGRGNRTFGPSHWTQTAESGNLWGPVQTQRNNQVIPGKNIIHKWVACHCNHWKHHWVTCLQLMRTPITHYEF